MAQTNVAYDLNRPERQSAPPAPRVKQPPELRVVETRRRRDAGFMMRAGVLFVMTLAIICAILSNKVALTELTAEIEETQNQLGQLQNENRRMQVELEGRVSLRTVEEEAASRLGMAKMESYQVEYVDLGAGDQVLMTREPERSMADRITEVWEKALEYLGL
ncbi:MAG: hypothetical protein RRY21_00940 [Oscillospiraceae bacterium]